MFCVMKTGSEDLTEMLVTGICCFGTYNWRLVTLESLNCESFYLFSLYLSEPSRGGVGDVSGVVNYAEVS